MVSIMEITVLINIITKKPLLPLYQYYNILGILMDNEPICFV